MKTTRLSMYFRALGFVAAACLAQAVISQDATILDTDVASYAAASVATAYRTEQHAIAPAARRCDALDAFGNPQRPCRN